MNMTMFQQEVGAARFADDARDDTRARQLRSILSMKVLSSSGAMRTMCLSSG